MGPPCVVTLSIFSSWSQPYHICACTQRVDVDSACDNMTRVSVIIMTGSHYRSIVVVVGVLATLS